MEEWGSVMSSNIFSNGASRRIELLADVQRRLGSTSESLEQVRSYAITMLHYACQAGDVAMVHLVLLLCRGVDVNGRNVWGGTPLHSLCRYGHLKAQALSMREIALMFVMHGADLELRDNYKKTAQDYAVQNQIFEVADVLSAVSGTPPETAGQTPLAARPSPLQTRTSPMQSMSPPPMPSRDLPPMTAPSVAPSTNEPLYTTPMAPPPLPPVSPSSPQQYMPEPTASHLQPVGAAQQPVMPPISPNAGGGVQEERAVYAGPPGQAKDMMDIRDLGLDAGPTEMEVEAKKAKRKNHTIMRHVSMIQEAPKQPYGPGRPHSRPGSRPASSKGTR